MNVKEAARELIDKLPGEINWDDIMYEFYVRQKVEDSIKTADSGKIISREEVKKRFLTV
ncbi:MAG TPA: hypothetical protein PKY81_09020 [bacterium]|nr:hypothetical protein [bacterium]